MARTTNNSNPVNTSDNSCKYAGLYLFGTVVDRTRRMVPKDNPTTEIITYAVIGNRDSKYYIEAFSPDSYYDIGSEISVPIYVKPYKRKNGEPSYTLMIQQEYISRGEHF